MNAFDFHLPTKILFGRGRITELGAHIPSATKRIFIVTDETIARRTSILETTLRALTGREESPQLMKSSAAPNSFPLLRVLSSPC